MKRIPLTRGQHALVDSDLFPVMSRHSWYAVKREQTYYAVHAFGTKATGRGVIYMHRLVYLLRHRKVPHTVDHVDGNGLNNQTRNLRPATKREQQFNKRKQRRKCTSRYVGVSNDPHTGLWLARISIHSRARNVGRYKDEFSAAWIRDHYALKYHGAFAHTNHLVDRRQRRLPVKHERRGTWKEKTYA